MSRASLTHIASAGFEGARRLRAPPDHHRLARWHGHSFAVQMEADLPSGWGAFPGAEMEQLESLVTRAVRPMDYTDLGALLGEPSDTALAEWVAHAAAVPGWHTLTLRSAPEQRVTHRADGTWHLARRYRFEAAHRLPNVPPEHQCGRMHGHGFEVELCAPLAGLPEWELAACLDATWSRLHGVLHCACLNDIEGLANPTSEMIARWIWEQMATNDVRLIHVCVFETLTAGSRYDGGRFTIWKEKRFEAALRIAGAPADHAHARLHGHGYLVRLHLCAPLDATLGWVEDFGDVRRLFAPIFHALDHQRIDGIEGIAQADCASILTWIREQAAPVLPALVAIELFERPGCGARLEWR